MGMNPRYSYTALRQKVARGARSFYRDAMVAQRELQSEKSKNKTLSQALAEVTAQRAGGA